MRRTRWSCPALGAMLLMLECGCLVVRTTTRVVRENEAMRMVKFESEQARSAFEAGVDEARAQKKGCDVDAFAIPFLCLLCNTTTISDSAVYNDQAALCDTDGDSLITDQESLAYRARVAARLGRRTRRQAKPTSQTASRRRCRCEFLPPRAATVRSRGNR